MNRDDQKNNLQKTASKKVEYRNRPAYSQPRGRSMPVSYTHLDVYKRQYLNNVIAVTDFPFAVLRNFCCTENMVIHIFCLLYTSG